MKIECVDNIEIKTNNNIISIKNKNFDHLYIANIDDNGEVINYEQKNNTLLANFFMVRIKNNLNDLYENIKNKKDIIGINLNFKNGKKQNFQISKKRVLNEGKIENKYEEIFEDENYLYILITNKNIKYKKQLFV